MTLMHDSQSRQARPRSRMRLSLWSRILSVIAITGAFGLPIFAQPADVAPLNSLPVPDKADGFVKRIEYVFDFDEPNNPHPVPALWVRIADALDFPTWNESMFVPSDRAGADPDNRMYQMETRGGNIGLRLVSGVIAAMPRADYLIGIRLRTEDLNYARGRLIARFVDTRGNNIGTSEIKSDPLDTRGEWQNVLVLLNGQETDVAWIVVEVVLEQPDRWMPARDAHEVRFQDVRGRIQFDDLIIWRLPKVQVEISDTNVLNSDESVDLRVRIEDISPDGLGCRMRVYDHRGTLVDEQVFDTLRQTTVQTVSPALPRYGWYRAIVDVSDKDQWLTSADLDFAWLAPTHRVVGHDLQREFVVIADDLDTTRWPKIATMLPYINARSVTLKSPEPTAESIKDELDPLQRQFAVTMVIDTLGSLFDQGVPVMSPYDMAMALSGPNAEEAWQYIDAMLTRYGQQIPRWQIGHSGADGLFDVEDLDTIAAMMLERVSRLVPEPLLILPWNAGDEIPMGLARDPATEDAGASGKGGQHLSMWITEEYRPTSIASLQHELTDAHISATPIIEPIDEDTFGVHPRVEDLFKRVILAREAGVTRIAFPRPWRHHVAREERTMPLAELPVWRNLIEHVGGREPAGRVDLAEGVIAIIFKNDESGTIAVWNESPEHDPVALETFLGHSPVHLTDLYGNRTLVPLSNDMHRIYIGTEPMFIDGADTNLALFRAGFKVEPELVEAAAAIHEHEIVLTNPWPFALAGSFRILEPDHWNFDQRRHQFSIGPGESVRLPMTFTFPVNELAGSKRLVLDARLALDEPLQMKLMTVMELGHDQIRLSPTYRIEKNATGGTDVVVLQEVTNESDEVAWVKLFAIAPGQPIQEANISALGPGDTALRVFRYKDAYEVLKGRSIRVGFSETDGPGRLNLRLDIE